MLRDRREAGLPHAGPRKPYVAPSLDRVRLVMKQEQLAPNLDALTMCTYHTHDMTGLAGC